MQKCWLASLIFKDELQRHRGRREKLLCVSAVKFYNILNKKAANKPPTTGPITGTQL